MKDHSRFVTTRPICYLAACFALAATLATLGENSKMPHGTNPSPASATNPSAKRSSSGRGVPVAVGSFS